MRSTAATGIAFAGAKVSLVVLPCLSHRLGNTPRTTCWIRLTATEEERDPGIEATRLPGNIENVPYPKTVQSYAISLTTGQFFLNRNQAFM